MFCIIRGIFLHELVFLLSAAIGTDLSAKNEREWNIFFGVLVDMLGLRKRGSDHRERSRLRCQKVQFVVHRFSEHMVLRIDIGQI
mmetsp:Transcript_38119/g.70339  ORF Transcript_38119/g.70339 Transcript_38119/m.70339 type:complete len:85 (-) Transcript_38119:119-373(-)